MSSALDPRLTLERIGRTRVVAILRAGSAADAVTTGCRLIDAELDVIEVSFTTPGASEAIAALGAERPEALVGAGTVLDRSQARAAVSAGARFLLSPAFGEDVHAVAQEAAIPYIPGVFTAAEVWRCLQAGLEVQKIFPAGPLGPTGVRALLEPFPEVRSLPTGGVSIAEAPDWLRQGAFALGMGGSLTRAPDPGQAAVALRAAIATV